MSDNDFPPRRWLGLNLSELITEKPRKSTRAANYRRSLTALIVEPGPFYHLLITARQQGNKTRNRSLQKYRSEVGGAFWQLDWTFKDCVTIHRTMCLYMTEDPVGIQYLSRVNVYLTWIQQLVEIWNFKSLTCVQLTSQGLLVNSLATTITIIVNDHLKNMIMIIVASEWWWDGRGTHSLWHFL